MVHIANLREGLSLLQDAEAQRLNWVVGNDTYFPDLDELLCQIFDDTGLSDVIKGGTLEAEFGTELTALLTNLDEITSKIAAHQVPSQLLQDPLLGQAREVARQILTKLT